MNPTIHQYLVEDKIRALRSEAAAARLAALARQTPDRRLGSRTRRIGRVVPPFEIVRRLAARLACRFMDTRCSEDVALS